VPTSQSIYTTRSGEFRRLYRLLNRRPALKSTTPICLCEGDSWFSTPLSMNLLDWLVFAPMEEEVRGVPVFGTGGIFFRAEHSGDTATPGKRKPKKPMFVASNINKLLGWYSNMDFDIALLSAGGNDFVGGFLQSEFETDTKPLSPAQAFKRVVDTSKFVEVRDAYLNFVSQFATAKPRTPILTHSYDYPRLLGTPANLTLANIGAAAMFAKGPGPWIGNHMIDVMPNPDDQRAFAALMIDGFVERVLVPVRKARSSRGLFDFVDFRGTLQADSQWSDEMHPTGEGFKVLADIMRSQILVRLPSGKVMTGG
jgi:hypothetical protein